MNLRSSLEPAFSAMDRVGGGFVNVVICKDEGESADQIARAQDNLAAAAELTGRAGSALVLEAVSHERLPGALVARADEAAAIVDKVDHPALRLLLDICHMHLADEDAPKQVVAHADRLAVVQIADMPGRVEPGAGGLDLAAVLTALAAIGFEGLVEAEFFASGAGRDGEQAALAGLRALAAAAPPPGARS